MEMMDMERREFIFFFKATFHYPQKVLSLQAFRECFICTAHKLFLQATCFPLLQFQVTQTSQKKEGNR